MELCIEEENEKGASPMRADTAQKQSPKTRELIESYLEQGLELVKVRRRSKAPSEQGWPDLPKLSLEEALDWLKRGGNIGVHLGRERGRIYAIDVDGFGIEKFFSLNPSLSQRVQWMETSPGRGRILVRGEGWNTAGEHDLQVLAERKQVLLPPSIHPNGHTYEWRGAPELPLVLEAEPSAFKFPFSNELSSSAPSNRNLTHAQKATLEKLEELLGKPDHIERVEAYWNCPRHGDDKTASFSYNLANHKYHCFHEPDPLNGQGLGKLEKAIGSALGSVAAPAVGGDGKGEEREEKGEATGGGSGGSGGSGQLVKLSEVYKALDDIISSPYAPDVVDLAAATVLNARLIKEANAKPLWLCIVGAPSSGKTEIITALKGLSQVYYLDDITTNAFSSGYVERDGKKPKDIDLLPKLDGKCFAVKDLSPLFSKRAETVQELLGQLPPIYDGEYDKATGTLGTRRYKSKFAWLTCITPEAIRAHQEYMAKLGSRILFYELPPATPAVVDVGFRLQDNANRANQVQRFSELFSSFTGQLLNAPLVLPSLSAPVLWSKHSKLAKPEAELKGLAQLIARGRALAHLEDRWIVTQSESPFRVYEQLRVTAQALALVHGRSSVADHDLDLIRRVALSSIPRRRSEILRLLSGPSQKISGAVLTAQLLAGALGHSQDAALRQLKELEAIGILEAVSIAGSKAQGFRPKADFMEWLTWPLRPIGPFHWVEAHANEDHPEILPGMQYKEHFNQPLT